MPHVLLIDDDAQVRALMRTALQYAGHQVTEADEGRRGVDAFKRLRPDVVVCDLFMPAREGMDTIRELRALSSVGILAISACPFFFDTDLLAIACRLGASAALAKPFPIAAFVAAVEALLNEAAGRDWCQPVLPNLVTEPVSLTGSGGATPRQ